MQSMSFAIRCLVVGALMSVMLIGTRTAVSAQETVVNGAVFASGAPREIGANPDVRAVYLGQAAHG